MSRTGNASRNIIWGILNKCVTLVLPFLTRTLFIYTLGTLYLGLNGLFTSVLQVLNISELGINTAITFSMYKPLAQNSDKEVNALLNFYRLCYRIIGFVVLIAGLCLLPFIPKLISGEMPGDINVYVLYLIYLSGTFLSYELFAYRTALLVATQRNDIVSKVGMVTSLIQFLIQFLILVVLKNYYLYILVSNITILINNLACAFICKKIYPNYYCTGKISRETFRDIKIRIGGMIFQKIGGVVLTSVDAIVISYFLGLKTLAIYQNYYFVITSLFSVLAVVMSSITASVGNAIALESIDKNQHDFTKLNFMYVWIVGWCSICLLCMYQPFIEIWVGTELLLPYYMVILFAIYFFAHKWCDMLYVYQEACGIWWETRWVPITAAILNLIINIVLVQFIGLAGILLSTVISIIFVYDIGYARVLFTVYFKNFTLLKKYIFRQIRYFICCAAAAVITVMVCNIINLGNASAKLIINGIICILIPNAVFIAVWRKLPEYGAAKNFIRGIAAKKINKLSEKG